MDQLLSPDSNKRVSQMRAPLTARCEAAGFQNGAAKYAMCFWTYKSYYILTHAPHSSTVVFCQICDILPMTW